MFKSFSILCYWLILSHSVIAQQPEILTANGKKLNLLLQAQVFEDKTGAESFTGIEKSASFTLITKPYIQKGFTASAFWIKFSIGNNDKRNWLIELDNKELDSAILYELKDKALIKVYSQGDFIRLKDDNTKDFFPLFQLNIPVGETRNYYLYIKSSSSVYFNCSAWPQVDYLKYLNIRDKSLWLFMGILALRLIYVLILQRFIKERSFTVYGWINIALFIGIVLNSVNLKAWAMPPSATNYLLNSFYWLKPERRYDIMNRLQLQQINRMNAAQQVAQMEAWARGVYTAPLPPIYVPPPRR